MFTLEARGPQGYKVVWYNAFRYLLGIVKVMQYRIDITATWKSPHEEADNA